MTHPGKNNLGFTLLEIIVVVVIIAILSAVAITRVYSPDPYLLKSETEVIKNHIRYAQLKAMNSSQVWGIRFPNSNSYFLYRDGNYNSKVTLPGENSTTVTLPDGVTINKNARTFSFDDWGIPYTNKKATNRQTGNVRTTKVRLAGQPDERIRISKNTGFIP